MANDFGFVHIPDESVAEQAPAKKSASKVTERSIVKKEKVGDAVVSTGGDAATALSVGQPLDPNRVSGLANAISNGLPLNVPDLGIGDLLNQYGKPLAELGLLGFAGKKMLGGGNPNAPVQPPEAKPDLRNFGQAPIAPAAPATPAEAPIPKGWEDIIAKSEANAAAKAAEAAAKANPLPQGMTPGIPTGQPNVPENPTGAFSQPSGYSQAAPQQTLTQAVETGGDVGTALKADVAKMVDEAAGVAPIAPPQELLTGTGKPAYAGQGPAAEIRTKGKKSGEPMLRNNYAKIEDVPAGYAFVPGAQHIDTSRTNIGQTEYTKAYTSRPFPASNELAVQESNDINRLLGRPTRAEAKAAGLTLPPQTPGITKHVLESKGTPFMGTKAAKVGGVLGALIAIPDLVNAQTVGQRGMAGANLLESVLPLGAQINEAGAPGVQQSQVSQAALLGSPYAQTEWAKTQRLRERAGAGRGIAPPSAYQR
jgi:hypothetical protein